MESQENSNKKVKIQFNDIDSRAWEHPADRAAIRVFKNVPGIDILIEFMIGESFERQMLLNSLANGVRANDKQFPRVHWAIHECCRVLDWDPVPEVFVQQNPLYNAYAVGVKKPFIVINSSLVKTLDDEELLAVIGHELGHIMSGHMLYHTVGIFMNILAQMTLRVPLAGLAIAALKEAYMEWVRKSELSADRVETLVTQDPEVPIRLLMKLSGGSDLTQMNLAEFIAQAEEYIEKASSTQDNILKFFNTLGSTHPFAVVRLYELLQWVRNGQYDAILRGEYRKRTDEEEQDDYKKDFEEAGSSYKQEFEKATKSMRTEFAEEFEKSQKRAREFFESFGERFGRKPKGENGTEDEKEKP